jgi:hypothetical protein
VLISSFGANEVSDKWKAVLFWLGIVLAIIAIAWPLLEQGWRRIRAVRLTWNARGVLYAGRVTVDDSNVATQHTISIGVFVFNGTNKQLDVVNAVSGQATITLPSGLGTVTITPPIPTLVPPFRTGIPPGQEFAFELRLHLSPADVQAYNHNVAGNTVTFSLEQVSVEVETARRRRRIRVPLWDGATLRDGRVTNRIVAVGISASVGVHASV